MSYIFTHGLFKRTLLETDPPSVQYTLQSLCNYFTKVVGTRLQSTGNLNQHYVIHHKGVPRSLIKERQLKNPQQPETPGFFRKYSSRIGDNIRRLTLNVIVSNNLPLSLVDSPSFRALVEALNPSVTPISCRTLMQDMTALFTSG
jgi:hypothetical protein